MFLLKEKKIKIIIFLKTILRNLSSYLYKYFRPSFKTRHICSPSSSCLIVQLFVTERQKENKTKQQDRLNEHNISYYIFIYIKKTSSSLHACQDETSTKINLSKKLKKLSFKESQHYNKREIQNNKKQHRCSN